MNNKKYIVLMLFVLLIGITACNNNSDAFYDEDDLENLIAENADADTLTDEEIDDEITDLLSYVTDDEVSFEDDLYEDYTEEEYTVIDSSASSFTITKEGIYVLTGEIESTIYVELAEEEDVWLILNNVTITSNDGPAICILSGDDAIISVLENTDNYLEDSSSRSNSEYTGTIYSEIDLTINGIGSLEVTSNYNNGIITKDDLVIVEAIIYVNSTDDGIVGRDSFMIYEANITVESDGDSIKTTNDTSTDKGYIYIESGTINIDANSDGIQAENTIIINGGTFYIEANEKGIQSNLDIVIGDGNITIDSSDDCFNSDSTITIYGGSLTLNTDDDAISVSETLTIEGGTIEVLSSYEGLESSNIIINGGTISIISSDDGINSAGSSSNTVAITGGVITVNSAGDGLDANGAAYISGGYLFINAATDSRNSALDVDGGLVVDGGTIIAFGYSSMVTSPSTTSEQNSIMITLDTQSAGTLVTLYDSNGNEVLSISSLKQFENIVISTSELVLNEEYTVTVGNTTIDFELESSMTYLNENGVTTESSSTNGKTHR